MTDNEIIKALEEYLQKCQNIKYGARQKILVDADFLEEVLDLINRKDAQIEGLQEEVVIKTDMLNRQKAEIEELYKLLDKKILEIKAQESEIERLNIRKNALADITKNYDWKFEKAKSEAIKEVLLTLEAEAESSDKYIREYDDSEVQRAYNKALWKSYNLVKEMVGE